MILILLTNLTRRTITTQKQAQQPQRRKSSNISNVNVSDDLQLAISKMLPTVNFGGVDVKPQVRDMISNPSPNTHKHTHTHSVLFRDIPTISIRKSAVKVRENSIYLMLNVAIWDRGWKISRRIFEIEKNEKNT